MPARGNDDECVRIDRQFAQRVLRLLGDYDVGLRESVLVGELLTVIGHKHAEAQRLCKRRD